MHAATKRPARSREDQLKRLIWQQRIDDESRRIRPDPATRRESELNGNLDRLIGGGSPLDQLAEVEAYAVAMEKTPATARPAGWVEFVEPACVLGSCRPGWSPWVEVAATVGESCPVCLGRRLHSWEVCCACLRSGIDHQLPTVPESERPQPSRFAGDAAGGDVGPTPRRTRDHWAGYVWPGRLARRRSDRLR